MVAALAYVEPGVLTVLKLSSFLLVSNVLNSILDNAIYCGLLGQILVGVAWGTPGGKLLEVDLENAIVQFGYPGLILIVYEGGFSTSFAVAKAHIALSIRVATTGICLPIAFSFSLLKLANATPLQAFAAGAALCSTSLGTTFTVLSTSGLTTTRLGTVLTTAAMLDDVVGLIMVQVISNLGTETSSFNSITVIRPVAVSIGLVVVLFLVCRFIIKPVSIWLKSKRHESANSLLRHISSHRKEAAFVIHTGVLIGMVAGASYAGTSNLFAAYLAGATVSWWESEVLSPLQEKSRATTNVADSTIRQSSTAAVDSIQAIHRDPSMAKQQPNENSNREFSPEEKSTRSGQLGAAIYSEYYAVVVQRILKPFFFASIGFSIPITQMFHSPVVWRGLVFTILMALGKILTGLCLFRISMPSSRFIAPFLQPFKQLKWRCWFSQKCSIPKEKATTPKKGRTSQPNDANITSEPMPNPTYPPKTTSLSLPKPISPYPASILGAAMVSRGEIGFLIASVAESKSVFASNSTPPDTDRTGSGSDDSSEIFLIIIWAIILCTIIGPLAVGTLVRRVKMLQRKQQGGEAAIANDPLGVWGIR